MIPYWRVGLGDYGSRDINHGFDYYNVLYTDLSASGCRDDDESVAKIAAGSSWFANENNHMSVYEEFESF